MIATSCFRSAQTAPGSPGTPSCRQVRVPRSRVQVMSTNSNGSLSSGTDGPNRVRRLQTRVRTLIVLVACCEVILWAWRHVSENYNPILVEARSIQRRAIGALQSGKPAERLTAIAELASLDPVDSSIAPLAMIGAL